MSSAIELSLQLGCSLGALPWSALCQITAMSPALRLVAFNLSFRLGSEVVQYDSVLTVAAPAPKRLLLGYVIEHTLPRSTRPRIQALIA